MDKPDTHYGVARTLFLIGEALAWFAVILGVGLAIRDAWRVDPSSYLFLTYGSQAVTRLYLALPGLSAAFGALVAVAIIHGMRATLDTADMTRELLRLARSQARTPRAPSRAEPPLSAKDTAPPPG